MLDFIISNLKEIVLGIIGLFGATTIVLHFSSKKVNQKQKAGNNSRNYQSGGDININEVSQNDK